MATSLRQGTFPSGQDQCGSCNSPIEGDHSFCTSCGAPRESTDTGFKLGLSDAIRERLEAATEGDYEILGELGRGGMGSVYLALDNTLHRHVAIKVMAPGLVSDPSAQERFRTEARIVAALRHPGIVNIYGFRNVQDLYFFVMDYVEGAPLRLLIRNRGALPVEMVRSVLYDVGSALHHAHSRGEGVIHRDVKPGNIIVDTAGRAVVMDFGISKAANTKAGLTMTGMIVGTPEYMSPEQCRGGDIGPATDQYSLGLVGYAMLTGAPPFKGQYWNVLRMQTEEPPPPIRELRPDCPAEVAEGVERMLAKAARERFPTIRDAVKAIGGRPREEGDPVREEITTLVTEVTGRGRTATPVASLWLSGIEDHAEPGDTLSVTVTPVDGLGRALPDRDFKLESTNPGVLEVVGAGAVRAVGAGSARLVARCEGHEASHSILVRPPAVASLVITPPPRPVWPGTSLTLGVRVADRRGEELRDRPIAWASSDPHVAHVDQAGELSALGVGRTTIFATSEGQTGTLELAVVEAPDHEAETVVTGGSVREAAEAPRSAERLPTADVGLPSSAPRSLTEGLSGAGASAEPRPAAAPPKVHARPPAKEAGRPKGPRMAVAAVAIVLIGVVLRFAPDMIGGSELDPFLIFADGVGVATEFTLGVGETVMLSIGGATGPDVEGPDTRAVLWATAAPSIAVVDASGALVGVAPGRTRVTAAARGVTNDFLVVVEEPETTLAQRPAADGAAGGTPPPDATEEVSNGASGQAGDASPPAPRTAAVSVRRSDTGQTTTALSMDIGAEVVLVASARGGDGSAMPGARIVWASSDAGVAAVAGGRVRGTGEGVAYVTARADGASESVTVTVTAPEPGHLAVRIAPWAYVSVDGESLTEDQVRNHVFTLPPGEHRLRLEHSSFAPHDTTIVITPGDTTVFQFRMRSGGQ